jgi:hypothetical protein
VPWTVTPEFPHGLSDEELAEAVTAISEGFYGASGQLVEMKEVPQLRLAMLQAALQEQSRRLVQEANRQS